MALVINKDDKPPESKEKDGDVKPTTKERRKIVNKIDELFAKEESKVQKVKTSMYMDNGLYQQVAQSAKDSKRSINEILNKIIEDFYKG